MNGWIVVAAVAFGMSALPGAAYAQTSSPSSTAEKEPSMSRHASGSFEVKLSPLPTYAQDDSLGRMSSDKQFHGDLEGTSKGEMLNFARSGYVAIEKVSAALKGRTGTFALQHSATMDHGKPHLTIIVVPDSGTGQLTGLTGAMNIIIAPDGKHFYEFDYTLPGTQ